MHSMEEFGSTALPIRTQRACCIIRVRSDVRSSFHSRQAADLEQHDEVEDVRSFLAMAAKAEATAQLDLQDRVYSTATTRAGHLRDLRDIIGPSPMDRRWQDEWSVLDSESAQLTGRTVARTLEEATRLVRARVDAYVAGGWPAEQAEALGALQQVAAAIGRAMREEDSCYAASTHTFRELLLSAPALVAPGVCPPRMFINLSGAHGLLASDPYWSTLLLPDDTGFRGLATSTVVRASCDPATFSDLGYVAWSEGEYITVDSDVVGFESGVDDDHGSHAIILTSKDEGMFPPNTLVRV